MAAGGLTSLADLEGLWNVRRQIVHADGAVNAFVGTTRFHRVGHRLIQDEEGQLLMSEGTSPIKATRRYIWTQERGRLECAFEDMRPFHTVPLGTLCPETTYLCPPDRYQVSYDFRPMDGWISIWRVEGPRKDYEMRNEYSLVE